MARIEWIKLRLENWALWKAREASGGLGFSSVSSFARDPGGGYREAVVPVDDVDASLTDRAVQSLLPDRHHLHRTLTLYYVEGRGIAGTSRALGKAASTIHAHLDQADLAIAQWFTERAAQRRKSFTT